MVRNVETREEIANVTAVTHDAISKAKIDIRV